MTREAASHALGLARPAHFVGGNPRNPRNLRIGLSLFVSLVSLVVERSLNHG
jgi:hypothetical protein